MPCSVLYITKKYTNKESKTKLSQICDSKAIWSHLLKKSLMENFIFCAVPKAISINLMKNHERIN